MLKVVQENDESNNDEPNKAGVSLLDEIVRDGARQMLTAALQAEVAAFVDAHAGHVDENGHRLVVRNGSHQTRELVTSAGAVPKAWMSSLDPARGSTLLVRDLSAHEVPELADAHQQLVIPMGYV